MENVSDIQEYMPHVVHEVMCWKCGQRWIAVHPETTLLKDLECPRCGEQGFCFATGQELGEGVE